MNWSSAFLLVFTMHRFFFVFVDGLTWIALNRNNYLLLPATPNTTCTLYVKGLGQLEPVTFWWSVNFEILNSSTLWMYLSKAWQVSSNKEFFSSTCRYGITNLWNDPIPIPTMYRIQLFSCNNIFWVVTICNCYY